MQQLKMEKNNMKAQIWFTDFVIAILIFSFILIAYYTYTTNISKEDFSSMDNLVADAKTISSSLTTGGSPENWNSDNVEIVGFTDEYNRIDNTKFVEFTKINYNKTKKLLGTPYDYSLFFVNESNDVQNVEGFCGTGNSEVNITYDLSAAYYYEGPGQENVMKGFMETNFNADVYYDKNKGAEDNEDQEALRDNINNYDFIVIEHPTWSNADFSAFVDIADPWVKAGGILFVGGQMGVSQNSDGLGVIFKKDAGEALKNEDATVLREDEFLAFHVDDKITFEQAYFVKNNGATDFIDVARFDNIIRDDENAIALARWSKDSGGVLFFSDFKATYLAGDFQAILEASATKWANAVCLPINIIGLERDNLVKTERLVIHNSDQMKMVLYLWD